MMIYRAKELHLLERMLNTIYQYLKSLTKVEDLAGIGVVSSLPRSGLPIEKCTVGWLVGIFVYSSSADDAIANVIIRVSSLAVNIVFAILANGIYKKRIDKLVNEMPEDPAERTKFIESKGGVSVVATVISIAIYIGLYLFI